MSYSKLSQTSDSEGDSLIKSSTNTPKGATIASSAINLLNSIIGAGVLTLPYSLALDGYVLGTIIFILTGFLTHETFQYLAYAAESQQIFVYKDLATKIFHSKGMGWFMSIIIIIYVCGSLTSYAIALIDNMFWWTEDQRTYKIILMFAIMLLLIAPLTCLKKLDFLKYNGYITLICEVLIASIIVSYFTQVDSGKVVVPDRNPPVAWRWSGDNFRTLPLFQVSFCGHFSTTFIYEELDKRNLKKFDIVIAINAIILFFLYILVMYFGYFTFTNTVHSDVLKTVAIYARDSDMLKVANIAMIVLVIAHYPATCFGARKAFESFFWTEDKVPLWGTILIVYLIVIILGILAMIIPELADVLDFTSSLAGSFVILMLPAAMAYCVNKDRKYGWKDQILPCCAMFLGACNFFFGLGSTIASWFE